MLENLEKELRKWRQNRASKPQREAPSDRRTVKVNGQEVARRAQEAEAAARQLVRAT